MSHGKTAKMVKKNRVIIVSGERLKVLDPPTIEENAALGTLYVFRCERLRDRVEVTVKRSPNAKIEVE